MVIEQADKVGGIARTETYKGYYFDIGGHRFFTKNRQIQRIWEEMLGEDFIAVERISRIYYQGRFFQYPLRVVNALVNLGLLESIRIFCSYLFVRLRPYPQEATFEHWVCNRFGPRLFQIFFKTYTEKVWGRDCSQIQADWATQRIQGLSLLVAVSNALFGFQKARSLIKRFRYPRLGPGMMWQRFEAAITAAGGRIRLDSAARRLCHDQRHVHSLVYGRGSTSTQIPVSHVISSVSLPRLVALLDPEPPDTVKTAARNLASRSLVMVLLIVARRHLFSDQWIYIHQVDLRVGRIQNFKNWSFAMVPDTSRTSIGMEYFCNAGDDIWQMSDDQLTTLAVQEFGQLGFGDPQDVVDSTVVRQPEAYPVYDRDYQRHLKVLRDYLESFDNLQTIGRNGMHRYNNMDHSMQTGTQAAQNILGARHDVWAVNESDAYLEMDAVSEWEQASEKLLIQAFARLDKLAFALACGTVGGLFFLLLCGLPLVAHKKELWPYLQLLAQYFPGYRVSFAGTLMAATYGFGWGAILGWLCAVLRNFVLALYINRARKKAEMLSVRDLLDHI